MDAAETSKWQICRICLKNDERAMHTIFEERPDAASALGNLVNKIELCGGVQLDNTTNMPDKICERCLLLLKAAYKFRVLCQHSQQQLLELMQSSITAPKSETNQEKPVEDLEEVDKSKEDLLNYPSDALKHETESSTSDSGNGDGDGEETVSYIVEQVCEDEEMVEDDSEYVELQMEEIDYLQENNSTQDCQEASHDAHEHLEITRQCEEEPSSESGKVVTYYLRDQMKKEIEATDGDHEELDQNESMRKTTKRPRLKRRNSLLVTKIAARRRRKASAQQASDSMSTYICYYCGNMYNEKAKLTLHIKVHTKEKPHECEICGKRFAQTPQLSRHMNSHTGNRPYQCKYCDASFADPSTRVKHQRIHTNERPYKCETCNKSFSYSNVLKVHMMTHTGEKPYSCDFCGRKFSQVHHKNSHERRHNNMVVLKMNREFDLKDLKNAKEDATANHE